MPSDRGEPQARADARRLIHLGRARDRDALTRSLAAVAEHGNRNPAYFRLIVGELIRLGAGAVRVRAEPVTDEAVFMVQLRDGVDHEVPIDDLDPPVRAMVRALLAYLNECSDDADFQLDLAVPDNDPVSAMEVVLHAVSITLGLLEWCDQAA
jgi:hypothetical protein